MALSRVALRSALIATVLAAAVSLAAGAVRLLPWLLDPLVTWRVAAPFARSLGVVAGEAALAVGWPIGWALASQRFAERGEARVFTLLGERPTRTAGRLGKQGALLGIVLLLLSFASARESTEPGRIVTELIAHGQAACRSVEAPRTFVVPFFGAAWLCAPGLTPRLAGQGPGRLASLVFSATNARASGDLGHMELDDATVAFPGVSLHVGRLDLRGASPWGHAISVPPLARAFSLSLAVAVSGLAGVILLLRRIVSGTIAAIAVGASGPLAALSALRVLERGLASSSHQLVVLVPLLALLAPIAVAHGLAWLASRLPPLRHAASSKL